MPGKTQSASNGRSAVKTKAAPAAEAAGTTAVLEPEPVTDTGDISETAPVAVLDKPVGPEQTSDPVVPVEPDPEPEPVAASAAPAVRAAWAGHVCCGLAVRGYSQTNPNKPLGMDCEVHGRRYWTTDSGTLVPQPERLQPSTRAAKFRAGARSIPARRHDSKLEDASD